MNKLFDFHLQGEETNRPYYLDTWEPIAIEGFRMPPFQVKTNSSDYTITQLTQASDYDITSLVNGVSYHNGYLTHDGQILESCLPEGRCTFQLSSGGELYFSDQCDVCNPQGWLNDISNYSLAFEQSKVTNNFHAVKGEVVNYILLCDVAPDSVVLSNGVDITTAMTQTTEGNFYIYSHTITKTGTYYITVYAYNPLVSTFSRIYKTYSKDRIKISISSTVDYADIYYKGGFTQELYRLSNVRRASEPKITVIGDERNGVIVKEKVITATKYKCTFKCNEAMLDALTTAIGADVTVTDQTGKVFTCHNLEIDKPTWYNSNGLLTITFEDNINVFTENSTDL